MRPDDRHPDDRAEDSPLHEIADRIGTGEHVDFDALARDLAADDAGVLKSLRTLSAIHMLHTSSALPGHGERIEDATDFEAAAGAVWCGLELREELGRGSYGAVWRAHDARLQRDVALKLLRPGRDLDSTDRERFLDEGRKLARVDHENVVRVHGVDEDHDRLGLWMELVEGRTVTDLVHEQGRFSAEEATTLGEKIARGLAAVHDAGVVHRDVKADNVMRADGGRVVLMDFGTAVDTTNENAGVEGTPFYLAPELFDQEPADARSDVYALGVLIYHMVTSSFPVQASSITDLARAHRDGRWTPLSAARADLPKSFVELVEKALAANPRDRFQTAGEFAHALGALGRTKQLGSPTGRPSWRPAFAFAGAATLAAMVFLTVFNLFQGPTPLTVDARFLRYGSFSTEELYDGARLDVGDALGLRIETSRNAWVYVFNRDAQGRFHVMFPRAGFEETNPVFTGASTELPGGDQAWAVDSVGGTEEVLIVVAQEPVDEIEEHLASGPSAPTFDAGQLEGLRGIGGVVRRPGSGDEPATGDFFGAVEALGDAASTSESGVWVRKLTLRNPG